MARPRGDERSSFPWVVVALVLIAAVVWLVVAL